MKRVLLVLILICSISACSHEEFDCKAFLASEVVINSEDAEQLKKDFNAFDHYRECGNLDDFDMKTLVNGPVIGSLIVKATGEGKKITYGYILEEIQKMAAMPGYKEIKAQQ